MGQSSNTLSHGALFLLAWCLFRLPGQTPSIWHYNKSIYFFFSISIYSHTTQGLPVSGQVAHVGQAAHPWSVSVKSQIAGQDLVGSPPLTTSCSLLPRCAIVFLFKTSFLWNFLIFMDYLLIKPFSYSCAFDGAIRTFICLWKRRQGNRMYKMQWFKAV